ncbi:hypothetical protein [Phytohabitans rumicis]|uniref:hypothetical protein n=1 Tax=Phytohabitans rumicis TaxID=1076125 RepID=UPI001563A570|nr:hypothetical protein [Phytohabitans rumicis]
MAVAGYPDAWAKAGRKLTKAVSRSDRDRFGGLVLDLIGRARFGQPAWSPRHQRLLDIGVGTATALAKEAPPDPELLAAAVALPWYDGALLSARAALIDLARPIGWAEAMVLAMAPAGARSMALAQSAYLRQLAALPPLLRAVVILERDQAAAGPPMGPSQPFDDNALALLAPASRASCCPGRPATRPHPGAAAPTGGHAHRGRRPGTQAGERAVWVVPDDGRRRSRLRRRRPGTGLPGPLGRPARGDPPGRPADRQPRRHRGRPVRRAGVDRRPGHPRRVPLRPGRAHGGVVRRGPPGLPAAPGWLLEGRRPIPDGLATLVPAPAQAALAPAIQEATARYAALLATETWPDFLMAWQVGTETVRLLLAGGFTDPELLTRALSARPEPDETDGSGRPGERAGWPTHPRRNAHWRSPTPKPAPPSRPTSSASSPSPPRRTSSPNPPGPLAPPHRPPLRRAPPCPAPAAARAPPARRRSRANGRGLISFPRPFALDRRESP